eukprot:1312948-Lingulodinium_polyedra.AAC.1
MRPRPAPLVLQPALALGLECDAASGPLTRPWWAGAGHGIEQRAPLARPEGAGAGAHWRSGGL